MVVVAGCVLLRIVAGCNRVDSLARCAMFCCLAPCLLQRAGDGGDRAPGTGAEKSNGALAALSPHACAEVATSADQDNGEMPARLIAAGECCAPVLPYL